MYEIAICDDDAGFASSFQRQLTRVLEGLGAAGRIAVFPDPDALLQTVQQGARYQLLFLDVLFAGEEKGIRLVSTLRESGCGADIVFMSTCPDYAVDSFDAAPLHYLVKPVADAKLQAAVSRFLDKNAPCLLRLRTHRGHAQLSLPEVAFFEIFVREIVVHKSDGTKQSCVGTLKELEERLPAGGFVRPHRSYLVNLDHIVEIVRYQIRVSTGETLPVSQKLYAQVQQAIIDHADRQTVRF